MPGAQATGSASPPAQYSPTAHGAHVGCAVSLPGAVCRVPGWQLFTGKHCVALGVSETVFAGQAAQA